MACSIARIIVSSKLVQRPAAALWLKLR